MATTQANTNFSIIIVPGSFTKPALYEPLITRLHSQGHDAQAISLLSANDGSVMPPPTTDDDAAHIRQAVISVLDSATSPKNVVLVLHSYAGFPGSSALKGLSKDDRATQGQSTAVIGVCYMASFIVPMGVSSRSYNNASDQPPGEPFRSGVPGGYMPAIDSAFAAYVFNDLDDEEERAKWMGTFTQHSSASFDGEVTYEPWKDIPSVALIPGNDLIVPTRHQESMVADAVAAGGKVEKVLIEGVGHVPHLRATERVVHEIVKIGERA
ncbi:hypothetical protein N0V82_006619 [Gnomoniopsis sp. IMI 355080]|nr:hypothetical protein N0V82_006619 [Gnomoniopsis sp. IMI 355080]